MKIYEYNENMTEKEQKDVGYWERNMLVMFLANVLNYHCLSKNNQCGWYFDTDNNWDGWKRVISLCNGKYCFHIPDDLEIIGDIPQIEPNWDGHTTEEKWKRVIESIRYKTDI